MNKVVNSSTAPQHCSKFFGNNFCKFVDLIQFSHSDRQNHDEIKS